MRISRDRAVSSVLDLVRRLVPVREAGATSPDALPPSAAADGRARPQADDPQLIDEVFWMILGRGVEPIELRDQLRGFQAADIGGLVVRLLSAPEFQLVYGAWQAGQETGRDLAIEERGLRALGPDARFISRAYELLLGRPVDQGGFQHLVHALGAGENRVEVLRSLVLSDEFARRYREISPQGGIVPYDTQLCELANPAKWDNPQWLALLRDLGLPDRKVSMHRKQYEFTQLAYGLERLGYLRDDVSVLSVGAGHERLLYWLANHTGSVVATDLYEGVWQHVQAQEGDVGVLQRPEDYAPFPYRKDRLRFLKMDGRRLAFAGASFDVVYSLSSIEHFGGLAGAQLTLDEMGRVLRPDGLLVLATEYVLSGPPHEETFQPLELAELLERSGLRLIQPIDDRVYDRYEYAAVDLHKNPHQTPHMVVRFGDTIFTSVMAFLRKP